MDFNHIVFIVMDSCRYDAFMAAATPNVDRLGAAQRRYSYASWTAPSHYAFTMGMMPHTSPPNVFASEVYKEEFLQWKDRTGAAPRDVQQGLAGQKAGDLLLLIDESGSLKDTDPAAARVKARRDRAGSPTPA